MKTPPGVRSGSLEAWKAKALAVGAYAEKLEERLTDPTKNWKFESGDLETRQKWDAYMSAYEDAISICNTEHAQWHIVPTDRKWYRVWVVSEIVRATLEGIDPRFPDPKLDPVAALKLLEQINGR